MVGSIGQGSALRRALGMIALVAAVAPAHAIEVTYDFVNVGYGFGSGYNDSNSGGESLTLVSSNLPVSLNTGFTDYLFGPTTGAVSTGNWQWSNGTDSLYGTFTTFLEEANFESTGFWRYTGTRTVAGGTGYFSGATGSGTHEFFSNYFDSGDPNFFVYQGIMVERMSVTVDADAPIAQTDTRPVFVLAKNGTEFLQEGYGTNSGVFTSRSPGTIDLESEVGGYTFTVGNDPLPFVGTFEDTGPDGTVHGTTFGAHLEPLGATIFGYATGSSQTQGGTGAFVGATGTAEYEAFTAVRSNDGTVLTYSQVVAVRINPVPEPAEYALLMAGFAVLGLTVRRRRKAM